MGKVIFKKGAAAAILVLALAVPSTQSIAMRGIKPGDRVKDYRVTLLSGRVTTLSELSGEKGLLVVFWATWSDRSKSLLSFAKEDLAEEYEKLGVNIAGINVESVELTKDEEKRIQETAAELEVGFPLAIDRGLIIFDEVGVITNPTTLLLNDQLILQGYYPGFPSIAKDEIPRMVNTYLGIEEELEPLRTRYLLAHTPKNHAILRYNLGKTLYRRYLSLKGELKRVPPGVIKQLNISSERDPDFYSPYLLKAIIYFKTGDEKKMEETIKTIEDKGFKEAVERIDMAYMYLLIGKKEKALPLIEGLIEEIPHEREVILLDAITHAQGSQEGYEKQFRLVLALEEKKKELNFDLKAFFQDISGSLKGDPVKASTSMAEKILEISKK